MPTLNGTDADDVIAGGAGDDIIHGGDGNDDLRGDAGNDTLNGDAGNDLLNGEAGDDMIDGGLGDDRLFGGEGNDRLFGGEGNDRLFGAPFDTSPDEVDELDGGAGDDHITAGFNDSAAGGSGSDTLELNFNNFAHGVTVDLTALWGGGTAALGTGVLSGFEVLFQATGSSHADTITIGTTGVQDGIPSNRLGGAEGDDILTGGDDRDSLFGDEGDDQLFGLGGDDFMHGGAGSDRLEGGIGNDLMSGGEDDDVIDGHGGRDALSGDAGNDTLNGDAGDDTLEGGLGDDRLFGGEGNDRLLGDDYYIWSDEVDELDGGGGDDHITAGFNDSAAGGSGNDILELDFNRTPYGVTVDLTTLWNGGTAALGTGVLSGFEALFSVNGSSHGDTITIGTSGTVPNGMAPPHVLGWDGDDRLTGGGDRDSLHGHDGDDILRGLAGDDLMTGWNGNDRLEGGAGNDHLDGGAGADLLIGGAGDDLYAYNEGDVPALDTIVEDPAESGIDTIEIHADAQVADSVWTGVRNVEIARLISMNPVAGFQFVLGAEFQASGFRTLIASADIDASAVTTGLTFDVRSPNIRDLVIIGSSGNDLFLIGDRTVLHSGAQQVVVEGGAGHDTLVFSDNGSANTFLLNANGSAFSGIEAFRLLAGREAVANTDGADGVGRAERYDLTMSDAWIAAGTRFEVDASALRSHVIVGFGGDGEIGGSGVNADLIRPETVTLDASALTGGRSVSVTGGNADDTMIGSVASDVLRGGGGNDAIIGGDGDDVLDGGAGDDVFVGGQGSDQINGGDGNDTVDYAQELGSGGVYVNLKPGTVFFPNGDTIGSFQARDTFGTIDSLSSIETVITGGGADSVLGGSLAERIETGAGNDFINGGGGADTLVGGSGDDAYFMSQASGATIIELADGGTDEVRTSDAAFTLAGIAHVENLRGWSSSGQTLSGNDLGNRITGREGNDILNGAGGNDTLFGDSGNDTIDGGSGDDVLQGFTGYDTVSYASASAGVTVAIGVLGAQDTVGAGTDTLSGFEVLVGSDHDDRLTAALGVATLRGGGGNDVLIASADGDRLFGEAGDDTFIGSVGDDLLDGGEGYDTVDYSAATGGVNASGRARLVSIEKVIGSNFDDYFAGGGLMMGGAGNDAYTVYSGNQVAESAGQGIDLVESWASEYTLPDNVENLSLHFDPYAGAAIAPEAALDGTGNSMDNTITGSRGANRLHGMGGADTLTGGAGIDTLTGGSGDDMFRDTASGLDGDTITDLGAGDRIVISNADLATFTFALSGNTLTYSGGSLTLSGLPAGRLVATAAAGGGVQLAIAGDVRNDFNGDGRSDILWRASNGTVTDWLGTANGGFTGNFANANLALTNDWQIAGTGDFNGDGRSDILWRASNGTVTDWLGQANGGFAGNFGNANLALTNDWQITGIGDFNGDGRDDILWRASNGTVTDWLGQANGGFAGNFANANLALTNDWQIAGTGDFNGDGRDDILWRASNGTVTDWLGTENGGFVGNFGNANLALTNDWQIAGTGDFNGDGRDDILWRALNGTVTNWLGQADGGFIGNFANANLALTNDWQIAGTGDFNGDGRDDVLWRASNGTVTDWLGQANGAFTGNFGNANLALTNDWQIQPGGDLF